MILAAVTDSLQGILTDMMALAAVAVIGYLFGRRSHPWGGAPVDLQLHKELSRTAHIAKELQKIAGRIRTDVAAHQSNISLFKARVTGMQTQASDESWQVLRSEAESLLLPTMKLATDLSLAYNELRKHSLQLMHFSGSRTDPHTGLHNRRAMEEQLEVLLALHEQNASRFALALFSVDCCSAADESEEQYGEFVEVLESCARDTDVVARYSSKEFVVLMPQTSLSGSMIFSERLLRHAEKLRNCIVAGGIVEVQADDNAEKLLSRADSALYSARASGYSCLFKHNGKTIREHAIDRTVNSTESEMADQGFEATTESVIGSITESTTGATVEG